jgi:hypothetical protein
VDLDPAINDEHVSQEGGQFTPVKGPVHDSAEFAGVSVRTFPKDTDHGELVEFLICSGLPESHKDNISIKPNGSVIVDNLPGQVCAILIEAIHNKSSFGKRLFCNGIVPCTPDKTEQPAVTPVSSSPGVSQVTTVSSTIASPADSHSMSAQTTPSSPAMTNTTSSLSTTPIMVPSSETLPSLVSPMSPNTFTQQYSETPDMLHLQFSSNDQLIRRNSLSLRSPPAGSLAAEILSTGTATSDQHYAQAESILSDLKNMSERYTDFGSCYSSSDGADDDGFKAPGRKKKAKKHKLSITPPGREYFMKKPNLASSPQI